jgi:hypothetical protein
MLSTIFAWSSVLRVLQVLQVYTANIFRLLLRSAAATSGRLRAVLGDKRSSGMVHHQHDAPTEGSVLDPATHAQHPSFTREHGIVNLRDLGAVCTTFKPGKIFRSSELLSAPEMQHLGIKTILDLRRMDRPCVEALKPAHRFRLWMRKQASNVGQVVPVCAMITPVPSAAMPHNCPLCMQKFQMRYGFHAAVVHADLIPRMVGFRIFMAMPGGIRLKTLYEAGMGKGAESVMAPAVANPLYMGYKTLYRTMIDHSKVGIAKAMRVFTEANNLPVLVHCIHGKDRTGLIVMLLLMLCKIDSTVIVDDYMKSESMLKQSRLDNELGDLQAYLTEDQVIAAGRDTMEDTIAYVKSKYGSVEDYLKACGLSKAEMAMIRINLLQEPSSTDLMEKMLSTKGASPNTDLPAEAEAHKEEAETTAKTQQQEQKIHNINVLGTAPQ